MGWFIFTPFIMKFDNCQVQKDEFKDLTDRWKWFIETVAPFKNTLTNTSVFGCGYTIIQLGCKM